VTCSWFEVGRPVCIAAHRRGANSESESGYFTHVLQRGLNLVQVPNGARNGAKNRLFLGRPR
jgi:hypothetical protein